MIVYSTFHSDYGVCLVSDYTNNETSYCKVIFNTFEQSVPRVYLKDHYLNNNNKYQAIFHQDPELNELYNLGHNAGWALGCGEDNGFPNKELYDTLTIITDFVYHKGFVDGQDDYNEYQLNSFESYNC